MAEIKQNLKEIFVMDQKDYTTPIVELNRLFKDLKRIEGLASMLGCAAYHEENLFGPTVWEVAEQIKNLAYMGTVALSLLGNKHGIMTVKTHPYDPTSSNP
jgi:hypothetical protein